MQANPQKKSRAQGKTLYTTNRFVRFIAHGTILALTILLAVTTVQFVQHSWHVLILALTTETKLWTQLGWVSLLLLLVLLAQVLVWPTLWLIMLWIYIRIFRYYRSLKRRQYLKPFQANNQGQLMMDGQKLVVVKQAAAKVSALTTRQMQTAKRSWHSLISASQVASAGTQTLERQFFPLLSSEYALSTKSVRQQPVMQVGIGSHSGTAEEHALTEDNLIIVQGKRGERPDVRPFGLFLVADGRDSATQGQTASHLAMQAALTAILSRLLSSSALGHPLLVEMMTDSVRQANRAIYQQNLRGGTALNVGLVAGLLLGTDAYIVSVGDCYAYQYRIGEGFIQLTESDMVRARAGNTENMRPPATPRNAQRGSACNFLGERARISVKPFILELQEGDCLFFCSRDLWKSIRGSEIEQLLHDNTISPSSLCTTLIQTASEGDGRNTSVILVRMA